MSARKKVTIVGAGMTGGAIAQRLVEKGMPGRNPPRPVARLPSGTIAR